MSYRTPGATSRTLISSKKMGLPENLPLENCFAYPYISERHSTTPGRSETSSNLYGLKCFQGHLEPPVGFHKLC